MKERMIVVCLVVIGLLGCAHPELTRRYHSRTFVSPPRLDCVTVSAFTMDVPGQKQQNLLLSLSGEGQAALVREISKSKSPGAFIQSLKNDDSGSTERVINKTVFNKRVVFAVIKNLPGQEEGDLTLADRINTLHVTLKSQKGVFDNWNKFETDYKTVDLGTIGRTQKTSAELEASIGPAAQGRIPGQVKGTLAASEEITESVPLRQQYIHLAGVLSSLKDKAELYQEGVVGIDLTGTFSVDFKLQTPNVSELPAKVVLFHRIEKDIQKVKQPDEGQLDFAYVKYVKKDDTTKQPQALKCELSYDYLLRHVVRKERETAEGYHNVHFWKGSVPPKEVILVSPRELEATVFGIYKGNTGNIVINIEDPYGNPAGSLQFGEYANASEFITWIKETQKTSVAKYKLYYGPHVDPTYLTKKDISLLSIRPKGLNYEAKLTE